MRPEGPKKTFLESAPPSPLLYRPLDLTDCPRSWKGYSFNFTHADFTESWSKKMIIGFGRDLPSLHNTYYFLYVSQESEGNLSARHAMTGAIEVRQAVKGNYSVYRVSSLCFSAVNSLGVPL